jgi:hypothetical protein
MSLSIRVLEVTPEFEVTDVSYGIGIDALAEPPMLVGFVRDSRLAGRAEALDHAALQEGKLLHHSDGRPGNGNAKRQRASRTRSS